MTERFNPMLQELGCPQETDFFVRDQDWVEIAVTYCVDKGRGLAKT
jgi:hypothetical protein